MGSKASSILEFCTEHGFGRSTYYNLPPEDRPRETRVRGRKIITDEDQAEWRRRMAERSDALAKAEAEAEAEEAAAP